MSGRGRVPHLLSQTHTDAKALVDLLRVSGGSTAMTNAQLEEHLSGVRPRLRDYKRFKRARKHLPGCGDLGGFTIGYRTNKRGSVLSLADRVLPTSALPNLLEDRIASLALGIVQRNEQTNAEKVTGRDRYKDFANEALNVGRATLARTLDKAADEVYRNGDISVATYRALVAEGVPI